MKEKTISRIDSIELLSNAIQETNRYFLDQVQKQVNTVLTLRNWVIGYYLVEYEQDGKDRSVYGKQLFRQIAERLKTKGVKSIRERHLYMCRDLYKAYPQILRTASAKSFLIDLQHVRILRTLSAEFVPEKKDHNSQLVDINTLLTRLSFSHFIELLKVDSPAKRCFYEIQAIKNNWGVRELKRAIDSLLFERTGLSTDKETTIKNYNKKVELKPEDVFRNPYLLEFLELEEKPYYTENDLEEAIINHLQTFLLELGKGFCFESRQKRITFGNKHYRIDLVFYHRILKCHVLLDLKIGEFTHEDAGQMNVYLNYYTENEMHDGDHQPVGIILCAAKDEALVKYATMGLPQQVFVSKYLINLPTEKELAGIIEEEQQKSNDRSYY